MDRTSKTKQSTGPEGSLAPALHQSSEDTPLFLLKNIRQIKENQNVLDDINLKITAGRLTTIIGPSGAGKTSLLRLLNRLDEPAGGEISYCNRPIDELPIIDLRREVGFVFQTPVMFAGTVSDNLQAALNLGGKPVSPYPFEEALALAGLDPSLAGREAGRLSVGQQQRVSIARALMTSPKVLLMDEPTSALDPETADRLMETIRRQLIEEKKLTVLMITHRLSEARRTSDLTIFMEAGRIIETGPTAEIFERSNNPRIRKFLSQEN